MIAIVLLAAGRSTRMRGADKLLEDMDGEPLLRVQAKRACATGRNVFVALPPNSPDRLAAIDGLNVTVLRTEDADAGLSDTLRMAVGALPDVDAFMINLCDLVQITTDDLNAVLDARNLHPDALIWRAATSGGQPGHPILFDASLRPAFASLHGDDGARDVVQSVGPKAHLIPLDGQRAGFDLDTPEDWAAYRKSIS